MQPAPSGELAGPVTVPPPPVTTARVVAGGAWSVGWQSATLLASLIATPFVIRLLGPAEYGVLALVQVLVGYASVSDVGMSQASTKLGAEAFARGNPEEESAVIWTALALLAVPALLAVTVIGAAAAPIADRVLHVPADIRRESILALRLAALALFLRVLTGVLNTPQTVRLRLGLVSAISNGGGLLQIAAMPIVLWWFRGGIAAAVAVMAIVACAIAAAHGAVAYRILAALRRPRLVVGIAHALLRYGGSTVVFLLLSLVLFNIEKFMVSGFASTEALAYYSVAFTMTRVLAVLPGAIGQPLLPAFVRLHTLPDRQPLQRLFDRSQRWLLLINLPPAVVMIVLAQPLLTIWAGPAYGANGAVAMAVLAAGAVVNGLCYVPIVLLQAAGRVDLIVRCFLLILVPYIALAAILIQVAGPAGAAYAWTARAIVEYVLMLYAVRGLVENERPQMRSLARGLVPTLSCALVTVLAPTWLTESLPGLGIVVVASALCYGAVAWMAVLTAEERQWLKRVVRVQSVGVAGHE